MWNLSAALPPTARVTGAWLSPIHAGTYNGSPFSVDVSDIDYGRDLSTGITTYDAAYWNDFGAMGIAGRAKYGSFTVNGIGDYTIQLGSSAVADLMNRFPLLNYLGAIVLALTAGVMMLEDKFIDNIIPVAVLESPVVAYGIPLILAVAVPVIATMMKRRAKEREALAEGSPAAAVATAKREA